MGQDLRFALRTLFKNRTVAAVAIVSLALIVAGNTVVFSIVNSLLIRPLPFDPEGRLLLVWRSERARVFDRRAVSTADFHDYRERSQRVFEELAAYRGGRRNLTAAGDPEELSVAEVTPSFFRTVKAEMLHGRAFRDDEGLPGGEPTAILTHAWFEKRFGGDPGVVGRRIELDHRPRRVVGVLAEGFEFVDEDVDLWLPLTLDPATLERADATLWPLVGKLRLGVTREQAQRELDAVAADLERQYPDVHRGIGIEARPFRDLIPGPEDRRLFQMMQGAGVFLLLIACANLANLLLARGQVRRRELALRTAVGASRARVVRQLLVESLMLAAVGGALGTALGIWGAGLVRQTLTHEIPRLYHPEIDARVLVFSLAISAAAGLVFGTWPALRATGGALLESLKDGPGRYGSPRGWLRKGLVVAQVALALVLLCGTGFLIRTMAEVRYADPGFDDDRLLTFQLTLPETDYPTAAERQAFFDELLPEVRSLPGAAGATIVSALPRTYQNRADEVAIAGRPPAADEPRPLVTWLAVPPGHFDLLSIPLLRGRDFTAADNAGAARVAIVDRRFAERFWPDEEAVGQRLVLRDQEWTVIGVAAPVMQRRLGRLEPLSSLVYLPWAQETLATARFLVRSAQENPSLLADGVRRAVWRLDADLPVAAVRSYDEVLASTYVGFTVFGRLMAGFGLLALLLAAIGVYGVLAYSVTRRTREIGVRVALGASRRRVLAMVLRDGVGLAAVGLAVGLPVVLWVRALLESTIEGLTTGWLVFVPAVVAALLVVIAAASFAPARRAARLAPVEALRVE